MAALGWLLDLGFAGGNAPAPLVVVVVPDHGAGAGHKKKKRRLHVVKPIETVPLPSAPRQWPAPAEPTGHKIVPPPIERRPLLEPIQAMSLVQSIKAEVAKPITAPDATPMLWTEALYQARLKQIRDEDEVIIRFIQSLT